MAQIAYRANLSSAVFPMTLAKAGRTVINPGADQNYDRRVDPVAETSNPGIPQAMYMENVLPTPDGFQSIGYESWGTVTVPGGQSISAIIPIQVATSVTESSTEEITIAETDDFSVAIAANGWTASGFIDFPSGNTITASTPKFGRWTGVLFDDPAPIPSSFSMRDVGNTTGTVGAFTGWFTPQGDPAPALYLAHLLSTGSPPNYVPYVYKDFNIANALQIEVEQTMRFSRAALFETPTSTDSVPGDMAICLGIGNTTAGVGLKIRFSSNQSANGRLSIGTGTGWNNAAFTSLAFVDLSAALSYHTPYSLNATVLLNGDNTYTATATITDPAGPTVLGTISTVIAAGSLVLSDQIGYHSESAATDVFASFVGANQADARPNIAMIDNLAVDAVVPGNPIVTTKISGVRTVLISAFTNNTCLWSETDNPAVIAAFENKAVTEGAGYAAPDFKNGWSTAYVRGESFLCIRSSGVTKIYTVAISGVVLTLTDVTADIEAGLGTIFSANDILGILSSYNYLILYTASTIFWSSTTTTTDFASSLVSGAGREIPNNLKSDISFCKEHVAGFYIYTGKNVIFAFYTGNARYPWKFREVSGSGGYLYQHQVAGDTNASRQVGVTVSGNIQMVSPETSEIIAPEVTDFLERSPGFDTFNYSTNVFSFNRAGIKNLISGVEQGIPAYFFLDRYIMVPYGTNLDGSFVNQYNYIIVYDSLLRRYGKLKIKFSHVFCNEKVMYFFNMYTGVVSYIALNTLGIQNDTTDVLTYQGVLVLGKFQNRRRKMITLEEIVIETTRSITYFTLRVLPSLTGKTFDAAVTPTSVENVDGQYASYAMHDSAVNHSLVLKGNFDVNTIDLVFHEGGDVP